MVNLDGKTILVTGGGSGIGLATAQHLVLAGANVVLAGRDETRLATAEKELDAGGRVLTVPTDISRTSDLDRLVARTREAYGHLDGVFANAGIGHKGLTSEVTEDDFDQVMGINFKGTYFTVQKCLPLLRQGSSIVLNASWLVHRGLAIGALYAATKAAVLNLTRSLAPDLAARGIRINTVTPGHITTEMFDAMTGSEPVREYFRAQVPLGTLGHPDDIADAVLFLLSSQSAYITGQELVVDGGLTTSIPG